MFLRIKRKDEGEAPEHIFYDDGAQQRTYKRLKVEESVYPFSNCMPLKDIHCSTVDISGQLVIPQPPKDSQMEVDGAYAYYELDPTGKMAAEDALVFEPLVHDDEGEESVYEVDGDDSNDESYYTNDYPDEYTPRFSSSYNQDFDPDDYYDETL